METKSSISSSSSPKSETISLLSVSTITKSINRKINAKTNKLKHLNKSENNISFKNSNKTINKKNFNFKLRKFKSENSLFKLVILNQQQNNKIVSINQQTTITKQVETRANNRKNSKTKSKFLSALFKSNTNDQQQQQKSATKNQYPLNYGMYREAIYIKD